MRPTILCLALTTVFGAAAALLPGRRPSLPRSRVPIGSLVDAPAAAALPAADPRLCAALERVFTAEATESGTFGEEATLGRLSGDLKAAGFELVGPREAGLAAALQPTAPESLRLSASLGRLDPQLSQSFDLADGDHLLYSGRVLIWRRGYGSEARGGRLVLKKLDYLQQAVASRLAQAALQLLQPVRVAASELAASVAASELALAVFPRRRRARAVEAQSEADVVASSTAAPPSAATVTEAAALDRTSLERTSLEDVFEGVGLRGLASALLDPSNLTEPTFETLVVAWRRPPPSRRVPLKTSATRGLNAAIDVLDTNRDGVLSLSEVAAHRSKPNPNPNPNPNPTQPLSCHRDPAAQPSRSCARSVLVLRSPAPSRRRSACAWHATPRPPPPPRRRHRRRPFKCASSRTSRLPILGWSSPTHSLRSAPPTGCASISSRLPPS
jgi:hypothetical protein